MTINPGWYPDPSQGPGKLRYWDGAQWSERLIDKPKEDIVTEPGAAQADWYPDPSQGPGKLRYWDGSQWTDQEKDMPNDAKSLAFEEYGTKAYPRPYKAERRLFYAYVTVVVAAVIALVLAVIGMGALVSFADTTYGEEIPSFVIGGLCALLLIPMLWILPLAVVCRRIYRGESPNTSAFALIMLICGALWFAAGLARLLPYGICSLLFLVSGVLLVSVNTDERLSKKG